MLLSWKSWSSQWVTGFLRTVSWAEWSHVSLLALRRIRRSVSLGQALLWRWECELKRDWTAMIDAIRRQRRKKISSTDYCSLLTQSARRHVKLPLYRWQRRRTKY
jgi:hypothetical protein